MTFTKKELPPHEYRCPKCGADTEDGGFCNDDCEDEYYENSKCVNYDGPINCTNCGDYTK